VNSRVHPKYKTKYRVGNWPAYERLLVQRGEVALWLSEDAMDAWRPAPSGLPSCLHGHSVLLRASAEQTAGGDSGAQVRTIRRVGLLFGDMFGLRGGGPAIAPQ